MLTIINKWRISTASANHPTLALIVMLMVIRNLVHSVYETWKKTLLPVPPYPCNLCFVQTRVDGNAWLLIRFQRLSNRCSATDTSQSISTMIPFTHFDFFGKLWLPNEVCESPHLDSRGIRKRDYSLYLVCVYV